MSISNTTRFVLSAAALAALALPVCSAFAAPGHDDHAEHAENADAKAAYVGDPYPLATDPVTGEKLTDEAVEHIADGRHLRFANEENVETFKADPAKYLEKVDAQLIEMQKAYYPLTTCPVTKAELGEMGEPTDIIVGNRLIRLCCGGCEDQVRENPKPIIEQLDAAVIEQQSADYPLTTCPVSGDKLGGEMGESVNYVVANRLVKLCCTDCVNMVKENPAAVLAKLDAAGHSADKNEKDEPATKAHDHAGHNH